MAAPTDAQRVHARTLLQRKLTDAPYFKNSPEKLEPFVVGIEASMFASKVSSSAFRDHLLAIVSNVTKLLTVVQDFDPAELGSMHPQDILDKKSKERQEKRSAKRSRETQIKDDTSIICTNCGLPRMTRLNLNRMGLDSEELGSQYEYNFETVCQCGNDTIELKINRLDDSSSSDSDTASASSARQRRRNETPADSANIKP
ncbi:Hypothetical protein, putative [Bodo saltans]|uniref:TFIIS central domain-containing protein n=1 Tax=Bodo saltans TaxID=75058 RepID=A0A0S4JM83_BODSA|nr:Hypothetical protein, putative [Bodo saltans]|eukprot:CUG91253.1 Hypothetical protein, putative [Bodo saltans]